MDLAVLFALLLMMAQCAMMYCGLIQILKTNKLLASMSKIVGTDTASATMTDNPTSGMVEPIKTVNLPEISVAERVSANILGNLVMPDSKRSVEHSWDRPRQHGIIKHKKCVKCGLVLKVPATIDANCQVDNVKFGYFKNGMRLNLLPGVEPNCSQT